MNEFVRIPLARAQRCRALLAAARQWEADLIPGTSTTSAPAVRLLRAAIAAFDGDPEGA